MSPMESKPIHIDFNIDGIFLGKEKIAIPKFVKAMVRLAKVVAHEKQRLVLVYPNYKCQYIPVISIASYFHFVSEKHSRIGFKLLIVTNSNDTIKTYQKLSNSFGSPFVDFIYSGYLSKKEYRRLKPEGSTRGSAAGKIHLEQSNVFLVKPGSLGDVLDHSFDLAIVEDCQKFLKPRYFNDIKKLVESKIPILAIMTAPDFNAAEKYSKLFSFKVLGWDEDLLLKDAKFFNDIYASSRDETFFPVMKEIDMPLDEYHKALNFIWSAYWKSRKTRTRLKDDPTVDRVFFELYRIMRDLSSLVCPPEILCQAQKEMEYVPLDIRIVVTRGLISQLPENVNETLEFEKILGMCETALTLKPTKQKFYEENLSESMVQFVAFSDKITETAMKRHFTNKRGLNTITPETKDQISKNRVILNNLTGKLSEDYRIIKSIKTEKLEVLAYTHEKEILTKLEKNRSNLKQLFTLRNKVLEELNVKNYS